MRQTSWLLCSLLLAGCRTVATTPPPVAAPVVPPVVAAPVPAPAAPSADPDDMDLPMPALYRITATGDVVVQLWLTLADSTTHRDSLVRGFVDYAAGLRLRYSAHRPGGGVVDVAAGADSLAAEGTVTTASDGELVFSPPHGAAARRRRRPHSPSATH